MQAETPEYRLIVIDDAVTPTGWMKFREAFIQPPAVRGRHDDVLYVSETTCNEEGAAKQMFERYTAINLTAVSNKLFVNNLFWPVRRICKGDNFSMVFIQVLEKPAFFHPYDEQGRLICPTTSAYPFSFPTLTLKLARHCHLLL